jgi:NADPH-dependent 2,4-dienoyl-CoA reductase/sulfur reductase-like enzyme
VQELDAGGMRVRLSSGETISFNHLVVATGARSRSSGVSGEDIEGIFSLRNVSDAVGIKHYIRERKAKRAVIVGSGFVSLEMCEAFRKIGLETTVICRKNYPMSKLGEEFAGPILQQLQGEGVNFIPDTRLSSFDRSSSGAVWVHTDGASMEADLVLLGIGVVPEVALAEQSGIELGPTGAIAVDNHMKTNKEAIYAAGDCCESYHRISRRPSYAPLGDTANKQGRIAGANIGGQDLVFPGIMGSYCLKVFDLEVASTGFTPDEARKAGMQVRSATIKGKSRAHSYPGSVDLQIRLIADNENGRLLGAQAIGSEGAVSRINALAAGLAAGISLEELAYLDLAYAPPFSGAWDPIHIAAQKLLK